MEDSDDCKLFVGGISWQTTDGTLKEHFSKYGAVVGSVIAKDRMAGTPRGFGFVCFSDSSAVDKALHDTHEIIGRTVEVKKAIPRNDHSQNQQPFSRRVNRKYRNSVRSNHQFRTKKIFVGGLSANLTEKEFKSYFEKFGRIVDVVVMYDNMTHQPRGFGFITFDSEDAVENVMQNNFHELVGKLVEVKRAVPKEGNNNGIYSDNATWGSGRQSTLDNYLHGKLPFYSPTYGMLPGYGLLTGYGGAAGYAFGGALGCGYPGTGYNAVGYGMASIAPSIPFNGPPIVGIRGNPLPYGSTAAFHPAYLNGGVGLMGIAASGISGNFGLGVNGKASELGGQDAQVAADMTSSQTAKGRLDVNSSGLARRYNSGGSKQNHR